MNRTQKRKMKKNFKRQMGEDGISKEQREFYAKVFTGTYQDNQIEEGTKVKLKINNFKNRDSNPKFIEWLEDNKENIFTVEYEPAYKKNKILCALKEDLTNPKWLFWSNDLEIIPNIEEV